MSEANVYDSENDIAICNVAFLQSPLDYLDFRMFTIMELNWYDPFGFKNKKLITCRRRRPHKCEIGHIMLWIGGGKLRNVGKLKTRKQRVFFVVKYPNLRRLCRCHRSCCLIKLPIS